MNTKYGMVRTDHILFIASGAFHVAKPSDLIPEMQGRFPIRVELKSLTTEDFVRILTEPDASLTSTELGVSFAPRLPRPRPRPDAAGATADGTSVFLRPTRLQNLCVFSAKLS